MLYSVLYSFYLQIIKKLSERFSTFPRSIIHVSVPGGIITVPRGFIVRFINLLFCNLIGQFVLWMVEILIITIFVIKTCFNLFRPALTCSGLP